MAHKIQDCDCKLRTEDEENYTKTLWSIVNGTERDCVLGDGETGIHVVEFEDVRRHSFEAVVEINSVEGCVSYNADDDDDVDVMDDKTKIRYNITLEGNVNFNSKQFKICLCDDKNNIDNLRTVVKDSTEEQNISTDSTTGREYAQDGGTDNVHLVLELSPEIQIDD